MNDQVKFFLDESEVWSRHVVESCLTEAQSRVAEILKRASRNANGCFVLPTLKRPKTRFHGRQVSTARFVYIVDQKATLREDVVVRHRCHNERCVNPEHLVEGSVADNKRDDWDYWANGVDYDLL